ncbi:glycosyltransferase [Euzebya tangerina]|uniref:glycosyltransferase n=1 Tax=Euzebya tangerina TaxID=591198 RepID=UPI000E31480D|nr:glycosyltransferase [Euzebya tangerina]
MTEPQDRQPPSATDPSDVGRAVRALVLTHVFPRYDGDPSAAFLLTWAQALRQAGHDVRVIAPHDVGLTEVGMVGGVPVRRVRYADEAHETLAYRGEMHRIATRPPFGPPLLGAFVTELAASLRRAVRRWQPDVLHVHWWMPGAVITRLAGVRLPTVVHLHGTDVGVIESRPWLAPLARWALDGVDRIEVVSTSLAERAAGAIGVVVDGLNPMPVDTERLVPSEHVVSLDVPVILAVGRLVPEKGFADLISAAAGLDREVRVRIVGEGPDATRLRRLAADLDVALELPGSVTPAEVVDEYTAADVVVQPSHGEGFGLVAAEAAMLGRPLVATDSGGVRDLLERGLLVRPGDIGTLRARLVEALEDPDLPAVLRAGNRVRRVLSPGSAVERTEEAWRAAIVSARTRGVR